MDKQLASVDVQGNNNAQGSLRVQQNNEHNAAAVDESAERRAAFLEQKLNDPKNMRIFTTDNNLLGPYWENVSFADAHETFQEREEPLNMQAEDRVKFSAAVQMGRNIANWHRDNKPVVCEYLLFLKDENLNILKPQYSAIIRKCSRKSKCYILITNRILNKQVGKFKWIKYLIVQIQGPDFTMVKICNTMLERWFPEYKQRMDYQKQRFKFGIYTTESSVDNSELYFPYQRSNKCSVSFGDMRCETPYGCNGNRKILDACWKANNRLFAAGNLLPKTGPAQTAQSYVFAYHPLGPHDKFLFRSKFGIREPPRTFTAREDIGYGVSSVCGPDFPMHPACYDKAEAEMVNDDVEDEEEENEAEEEVLDSSHFILADKDMKAKFKLKKMKLIMNRRREWIFGERDLGVPFPQVLLPTTSILESKTGSSHEDSKMYKNKKKLKPETIVKNIRFINQDNIYLEYCFEKEHLKRNPISPYPRSLVPGRELAERINVNKMYIGPIKYDFVKDRRDELNQRFQMLGQVLSEAQSQGKLGSGGGGSGSGHGTGVVGLSADGGGGSGGRKAAGGGGGAKRHQLNNKDPRLGGPAADKAALPVVTFADFKAKLTRDAASSGGDVEDLLGKDRINAKNVDKVVPGWRGLVARQESIFDEVKTRLNVHRSLKDRYNNVKNFFNPLFDPYEDIPTIEAKSFVQPKVKRQVVKGIPLSEGDPHKVATVLGELMEVFKREDSQHRTTGT